MLRRLVVLSLPLLAAAAVVTIVVASRSGGSADAPKAHTRPVADTAAGASSAKDAKRAARTGALGTRSADEVRGAAARRMPVPILMYHVIGTPKPGTPNLGLWVTPALFASQMRALRRAGYTGISLAQAWRGWTRGGPLPRKPVVVSFDDGYPGDYKFARPVLRRLGWPGVLNVALHDVGAQNLSSHQLRGLIAAGWEIDSHTINHPDLTTLGAQQLDYELRGSRRILLDRFGVHALFFCYPGGRYDARVEAAVKAAGYRAATTEDEGYATPANPFALKRIRVQGGASADALLAQLRAERPPS